MKFSNTKGKSDNLLEKVFNLPRLYQATQMSKKAIFMFIRNLWWKNYQDPINIFVNLDFFKGQEKLSIFEIGSGSGIFLDALNKNKQIKPFSFTGSDININMVNFCRLKFPESQWEILDTIPYNFKDKSFDAVVIWNVLHHLNSYKDIEEVLNEALRIGRRVIIFEPLQSKNKALKNLKLFYWKVTDGGKYYFMIEDFHKLYKKHNITPVIEHASEPLNQVYYAVLKKEKYV